MARASSCAITSGVFGAIRSRACSVYHSPPMFRPPPSEGSDHTPLSAATDFANTMERGHAAFAKLTWRPSKALPAVGGWSSLVCVCTFLTAPSYTADASYAWADEGVAIPRTHHSIATTARAHRRATPVTALSRPKVHVRLRANDSESHSSALWGRRRRNPWRLTLTTSPRFRRVHPRVDSAKRFAG